MSFLGVLKKTLQMFLATKKILNGDHEYAVVLMQDNTTIWVSVYNLFLFVINKINPVSKNNCLVVQTSKLKKLARNKWESICQEVSNSKAFSIAKF